MQERWCSGMGYAARIRRSLEERCATEIYAAAVVVLQLFS
jgi:hypothetical protein